MSPGFLPIKATWHKLKAFLGKKVDVEDLSQGDIIIIVMGPTGSGKSSFIETVTGIKGTVYDGLRPQKTKISVTKLYFPEFDCDIHFVDTPGFDGGDGTDESEADIFDMISKWMIKTYQRKLQVAGLLYFHRISDNRLGWSGLSSLRLFNGLCGEKLNNIVLTTTMWDSVDQKTGVQREEELCTTDRFWKRMLDRGSCVKRFRRTKISAYEVLAPIFEQINERKAILLTQTVADLGRKLKQSADGRELFSKIEDLAVVRQEISTRIRNGRQDPSLTPVQFQLLLEEYEKARLDMQRLMDKAKKDEPNTQGLVETRKQFFENMSKNDKAATSSQPSKSHISPRRSNQNWKPQVPTNPGSMGEQNLRQGRDGRMQSPSMGPVANPPPTHDRNPRSTFQDHHASRDNLASSSRNAEIWTAPTNKQGAQFATMQPDPIGMAEYSSKYVGSSNQGQRVTSGQDMAPRAERPYRTQHIIGGSSQAKGPQRNDDERPRRPPPKPGNLRGNALPRKNATLLQRKDDHDKNTT